MQNRKLSKESIVKYALIGSIALLAIVLCIIFRNNLYHSFYNNFIRKSSYKNVVTGLKNTFLITIFGFVIGLFMGLITCLVLGLRSNNTFVLIIKQIFKGYVSIFRGTPMMVQLLIMYFIIFVSWTFNGSSLLIAIIAFGLNSGAYISEILRGGIGSVPIGQMEAGRSLGLPYSKTMIRIVFPQAIKNSLPSLGNELITLFKETSIAGYVSVLDLTLGFKKVASNTYDFVFVYLIMGLVYFAFVMLFTFFLSLLERSLNKNAR